MCRQLRLPWQLVELSAFRKCPPTESFICGLSSKAYLLASLSPERCSGGQFLSTFSDLAGGLPCTVCIWTSFELRISIWHRSSIPSPLHPPPPPHPPPPFTFFLNHLAAKQTLAMLEVEKDVPSVVSSTGTFNLDHGQGGVQHLSRSSSTQPQPRTLTT